MLNLVVWRDASLLLRIVLFFDHCDGGIGGDDDDDDAGSDDMPALLLR